MMPKGDRGSKRALFLLCREGTDGHPAVWLCCTWHELRRSWANGGEQRKDCLHWLCARRDFLSELIGSWFPRDEKERPRNTGSVRGDGRNPRLGSRSVQMHHSTTCLVSQKAGVWGNHKIQKVPCHGDLLGAVKSMTFIMEILDNFWWNGKGDTSNSVVLNDSHMKHIEGWRS